MKQLLLNIPYQNSRLLSPQQIPQLLATFFPSDQYYLLSNGRLVQLEMLELLPDYSNVNVQLVLKGGKGGYGQNMKSKGSKKFIQTNLDQSRDLSGRKVLYNKYQRKLIQYFKKKKEEQEYVKKQIQKFRNLEETIKQERIISRIDHSYNQNITESENQIKNAVKLGLKRISKDNFVEEPRKKLKQQVKKEQEQEQHPFEKTKSFLTQLFSN